MVHIKKGIVENVKKVDAMKIYYKFSSKEWILKMMDMDQRDDLEV